MTELRKILGRWEVSEIGSLIVTYRVSGDLGRAFGSVCVMCVHVYPLQTVTFELMLWLLQAMLLQLLNSNIFS